jgi:predicted aspartyl protease
LVDVLVNGTPVKAIVDTAAQISVINKKLASSLTPPLSLGKEVTLKGVGD